MSRRASIALVVLLAASCAPKDAPKPIPVPERHAGLTDGWWRLVEIRSGKETRQPDDPLRYTLTLHDGGIAEMQLDCNKGRGKYEVKDRSRTQGDMRIGPLAVTKMFCGAASLGDAVGRGMDDVRSYRIDGNRLYLSLAGGGISVWELASLD